MVQKNNTPYIKIRPATPSSSDQLWDFLRIGYVGCYCLLMLIHICKSWVLGSDIATRIVRWETLLLYGIFSSMAVLFATQLQIEKRKLNTSISRHLGIYWQGGNLQMIVKMIGLFCFVCVMAYISVQITAKHYISTTSAKIGTTANSPALGKPWWTIWVVGLYICLLAPITQGIFFWGVIMYELRTRGISKIYAWLATAILFMVAQGNLGWEENFLNLFFGLLFGWLAIQKGALLNAISLHIYQNTRTFFTLLYLLSCGIKLPDTQFARTIIYYYLPS